MDYVFTLLTNFAIAALLAGSLNLIMGYAGLVWIAQASLMGSGAYAAAYAAMQMGVDMSVGFVFGAVVAAAVAAAGGALTARLRDHEFVLASFAIQIVLLQVMERWTSVTRGNYGLAGVPRPEIFGEPLITTQDYAILALVVAAIGCAVMIYLVRSPFGLVLRGVRESPRSILASGRSTFRISVTVLAVGGFFAGLAGGLYAAQIQFLGPATFDVHQSILIVVYLIVGGLGNMGGAILGAAVLTALPEVVDRADLVATQYVAPVQQILFGLVLMLCVALRPQGLWPERPIVGRRRGGEPSADVPEHPASVPAATPANAGGPALETDGLTVRFGGLVAVNEASVTVKTGSVTALIGPNGAGKSTLLGAITGFTRPTAGRVRLRSHDITARAPNRIASLGVARTFQDLEVYRQLTAIENVILGFPNQPGERPLRWLLTPWHARPAWRRDRAAAQAILDDLGLGERAHLLVSDLSYGEQKLLVLGRLIASGADILLLDEPGSGLPSNVLERVGATLRQLAESGKTILLVDHNMDLIMGYSDHIHVLHHGRVIATGAPEEIRRNDDVIRVYLTAGAGTATS